MTKPTAFQEAYDRFEKDLIELSNLAADLATHVAMLNAEALMLHEKATINFQPSGTCLRDILQDLEGQLQDVDYDEEAKERPPVPDPIKTLFAPKRMRKCFEGFQAMMELSYGVSKLERRRTGTLRAGQRNQNFGAELLHMHGMLSAAFASYIGYGKLSRPWQRSSTECSTSRWPWIWASENAYAQDLLRRVKVKLSIDKEHSVGH